MSRYPMGRFGKHYLSFLQKSLLVGYHRRLARYKGAIYGA